MTLRAAFFDVSIRSVWRTGRERSSVEVDVTPDATIRDLTELPGVVARWLDASERVA